MNVVTEITPGDFGAFAAYVSRQASSIGSSLLLLGVAAVVGIVMADVMPLFGSALHIPTFLVAMLGFASFIVVAQRIRRRRLLPRPGGLTLGRKEIVISDEGVREYSVRHEALFRWSAVESVGVTTTHIFVMLDRSRGIIVPRRSFASPSDGEQFVGEIRRRLAHAN